MKYRVVKEARHFDAKRKYSAIDWSDLNSIVDAFQTRIQDWYLAPAHALNKRGHLGFAAMALSLLLIDTLSQFYFGESESDRCSFIRFIGEKIPKFASSVSPPIKRWYRGKEYKVTNVAEILYFGFRCGIIHQAHAAPYCLIQGQSEPVVIHPSGYTTYADGSACPSAIIDPWQLLDAVEEVFRGYCADVKKCASSDESPRKEFERKYPEYFGVDHYNDNPSRDGSPKV